MQPGNKTLNLDQTVTVSPDVMAQEVNGETVLLDLQSELYFGLNDVGTRTWQLLCQGQSIRQVLANLLDEFEVDETTAVADISQLVTDMEDQGIITLGMTD